MVRRVATTRSWRLISCGYVIKPASLGSFINGGNWVLSERRGAVVISGRTRADSSTISVTLGTSWEGSRTSDIVKLTLDKERFIQRSGRLEISDAGLSCRAELLLSFRSFGAS